MGCGSSAILDYTVQYCVLQPIPKKGNIFKIHLLAEENLMKIDSKKFLNQIGRSNNQEIKTFLERPNFESNTIFYYYLREEPLVKTYSQSKNYVPFNLPYLTKIILLSTDLTQEYSNQIIENETKHLGQNNFINYELDLNEVKKKLDDANNPNITKDSLSLKENTMNNEDELIKEKEGEIIISEEIT